MLGLQWTQNHWTNHFVLVNLPYLLAGVYRR